MKFDLRYQSFQLREIQEAPKGYRDTHPGIITNYGTSIVSIIVKRFPVTTYYENYDENRSTNTSVISLPNITWRKLFSKKTVYICY